MSLLEKIANWFTVAGQGAVVLLTLGLFHFGYHRWSSPKTRLKEEWLNVRSGGESFSLKLKNEGDFVAIFRIRVFIHEKGEGCENGEPPYIKRAPHMRGIEQQELDFDNCLFAQNPIPSPFAGRGPYPKRTRIYPKDFNNFSNRFGWVGPRRRIMKLPASKEKRKYVLRFEVEQTGENYIFKYESEDNKINKESIEKVGEYGGRTFMGRFKKQLKDFDWNKGG